MWTPVVLISIGASAVIGAVIGFLFSRAQSQRSIATVESELAHTQQQLNTLTEQYSAAQQEQQTRWHLDFCSTSVPSANSLQNHPFAPISLTWLGNRP